MLNIAQSSDTMLPIQSADFIKQEAAATMLFEAVRARRAKIPAIPRSERSLMSTKEEGARRELLRSGQLARRGAVSECPIGFKPCLFNILSETGCCDEPFIELFVVLR